MTKDNEDSDITEEDAKCKRCSSGKLVNVPDGKIPADCEICKSGTPEKIEINGLAVELQRGGVRSTELKVGLCEQKEVILSFLAENSPKNCSPMYRWNFGNGKAGSGQTSETYFDKPGNYNIEVEAKCENCSKSWMASLILEIEKGRLLEEIIDDYRKMIAAARALGFDVSASNLEHFLGASGAELTLDSNWLQGYGPVKDAIAFNKGGKNRFDTQIQNALDSLAPGQSTTLTDYWHRNLYATHFTDLYFASGGSNIRSEGNFTIAKAADGTPIVTGTIVHNWSDPYDWHNGLAAYVPGFGNVQDSDGNCLIENGKGKTFNMRSSWSEPYSCPH